MDMEIILHLGVSFVISLIFVPIIGRITKKLGIIAHINERTIHKGIISRTGGYAIYAAFLIAAAAFLKTDQQINAILIGGLVIFLTGFYDDIHDLSPKLKLLGQLIAALIVIIYGGISLKDLTLPFIPTNITYAISLIITLGWIVGITNAMNLIDGLDGLCAGISMITLMTISASSFIAGRGDIASLSMILVGAIGGFLVYNFHPAKIFMGDCGALFIGYMISVISLLGFGYETSTFFTLGAPIVVLAIPVADTLIAIIRRRVNHKQFDEADRGHLHHQLMFKLNLGQTKSVLILYLVTALFAIDSFIYERHPIRAVTLFIVLLILFELFVEVTDMISRKYKPVLTIANIFIKSDKLPKIKESAAFKKYLWRLTRGFGLFVVICIVITGIGSGVYYYHLESTKKKTVVYEKVNSPTTVMNQIYSEINKHTEVNNEQAKYVCAYFACDYYTLSNKGRNDIGGQAYFYKSRLSAFKNYAKKDYYKEANKYISSGKNKNIEVSSYRIISAQRSQVELSGLEGYRYYDIQLELTFKKKNPILGKEKITLTVTCINKDDKISVVSFDDDQSENNDVIES
ncbi:MraY family glycosyltransferase [Kandleria sp.]|uniref:MraY family glycosyltransferase n=1 Tax=Kandleria sp. TaxID=2774291 RepID=UPI001B61D4C8|nr:MraY family glycosyltransferase [Kandleria sp.]MBP3275752.1 undecaprenyl/decaprenyl-phosphate alpha-N-acetylglucosaminyl 1-phosphate transferase [Kandleria sp.]